ncbi:MAG: aminoacyl-tRNA hydrolase [bacterium]|nr:aminoacyl-tRNA hydrolase [bacterium]
MLIVGLGNPGKEYEKTRHNVGFMVADALKGIIKKNAATILKPKTFMNESGRDVRPLMRGKECLPETLFVIHDDLDLPVGTFRISRNASSAGHNGVQSIIDTLGSKNFTRFRIGIRPDHPIANVERFVLTPFAKKEWMMVEKVIASCVEAIEYALANSVEKTASIYNVKK